MPEQWNNDPAWNPLSIINDGITITFNDGFLASDQNKIVENLQYLYNHLSAQHVYVGTVTTTTVNPETPASVTVKGRPEDIVGPDGFEELYLDFTFKIPRGKEALNYNGLVDSPVDPAVSVVIEVNSALFNRAPLISEYYIFQYRNTESGELFSVNAQYQNSSGARDLFVIRDFTKITGDSVAHILTEYAVGDYATQPSIWQSTMPALSKGSTLWTRTTYVWVSGKTEYQYNKSYQGIDGNAQIIPPYIVGIALADWQEDSDGFFYYQLNASSHQKGTQPQVETWTLLSGTIYERTYDSPSIDVTTGNIQIYSRKRKAMRLVVR